MATASGLDRREYLERARWRSRRGMLEIDFFLVGFAENRLADLGEAQQAEYTRLLECEDVDLHAWLTGRGESPDAGLHAMITLIREYAAQPGR